MRIDLHCHLLPGVDDGARDVRESLQMARALVALGYSQVAVTPHARPGFWMNLAQETRQAVERLQQELLAAQIPLALRPGAENFFDHDLEGRLPQTPGWGAQQKTFLVELSHNQPPPRPLAEVFFRLRVKGYRLILAHPERYQAPEEWLPTLRAQGVRAQVSLTSLAGKFGRNVQKVAQRLVEAGEIDLAATDAHRVEDIEAAAEAIRWIEQRLGAPAARRLTQEAPEALLSN